MSGLDQSALWTPENDKGEVLFTAFPNCFLKEIVEGRFTFCEIRILSYVCKMSFGFNREQTNYISSEELKSVTGIKKTHLSKHLKCLQKKGILFCGAKSGCTYKYAINLLRYGLTMKYYRIVEDLHDIGPREDPIGTLDYQFGNFIKGKKSIIVYDSKGYEKVQKVYTKNDRNTDIKKDNQVLKSSLKEDKLPLNKEIDDKVAEFKKLVRKFGGAEFVLSFMKSIPSSKHYMLKEAYIEWYGRFKRAGVEDPFIKDYEEAERLYNSGIRAAARNY